MRDPVFPHLLQLLMLSVFCLVFSHSNRYVVKNSGLLMVFLELCINTWMESLKWTQFPIPIYEYSKRTGGCLLALHICKWKRTEKPGNLRPLTTTKPVYLQQIPLWNPCGQFQGRVEFAVYLDDLILNVQMIRSPWKHFQRVSHACARERL